MPFKCWYWELTHFVKCNASMSEWRWRWVDAGMQLKESDHANSIKYRYFALRDAHAVDWHGAFGKNIQNISLQHRTMSLSNTLLRICDNEFRHSVYAVISNEINWTHMIPFDNCIMQTFKYYEIN